MQVSKRLFSLETESAFAILAKVKKLELEGKDIINLASGTNTNVRYQNRQRMLGNMVNVT